MEGERMFRDCLVGLALGLLCSSAWGFEFRGGGPYLDGVPTPEEFLGYETGTLHTHHFRMEDYFEALVESAPDRVRLESYGSSYEHKDLFLAIIASPENLERIEEIRRTNLRLADPRLVERSEADAIVGEAPVIVWLDYGNDGNETANVEAAMQVAYELIAGESDETRRFRREAVILLEPDHNPESHDRHVAWYNAFGVGDADPMAMEHHAPWGLSTNNNHYQIDLNRDAWALTQRENQAVAAEILRWRPQVFVDHHGQTENYFFPPPATPMNPVLPDSHRNWYEEFGRGNARAFDAQGWQYYVRDVFDLFYPGYWDSWPSLHGAIGMTYETDGGGARGLAWRRRDGSLVTFRDGIAHHFVASLATVRTAVEHRESLLRDFWNFFAVALEEGLKGDPARSWVLDPGTDPRRAAVLASVLLRHGVEVRRTLEPASLRLVDSETRTSTLIDLPAGSYLIDMEQPDKRVAATLLTPEPALDPAFVERQMARWSRNARRAREARQERYEFYDITAWSLPIAFGVRGLALDELPRVATEELEPDAGLLAASGHWGEELAFEPAGLEFGLAGRIADPDDRFSPAGPTAAPARSAYLVRPEPEGAVRLLAALMKEGFRTAVSLSPLVVGAEEFPKGTLVLRVDRNPETLHERLAVLAREAMVPVVAADTAFAAKGSTGPGSNTVVGLDAPRVAMIADEGVRITEYGAAWFTLEGRLGYPFTPVRFRDLLRSRLDEIDVIVLPNGRTDTYRRALGDEGLEALEGWLERGGTLVGWGPGAASLAIRAGWVTTAFAGVSEGEGGDEEIDDGDLAALEEIDAMTPNAGGGPTLVSPTADPGRPQPVPGAVFTADLDPGHWITLGYSEPSLPVLVRGGRFLVLSREGDNPVAFGTEGPLHVAGFHWPGNTERWLRGTAWTVVEPVGRGQVILFADDPNFRLTWRATSRLFANAVLLGPTLGARLPPKRSGAE